jgi:hypothetical protein
MTEKTCFVIGPIGPEGSEIRRDADWLLEGIIAPVVTEFGFRAVRADKIATPGMIDAQVINHVIDDELVIADLSNWNANAFYELGLRHMAERPVIHMIDRAKDDLPFDVKPYRTILFGWTSFKELEQSKEDLRAQVLEVLDESHTVDNPVIRARGQLKLRQTASPKEQEILSMIEDLRSQVRGLEAARIAEKAAEETARMAATAEGRLLALASVLEDRTARALADLSVDTIGKGIPPKGRSLPSNRSRADAPGGAFEPPYPPPKAADEAP